MKKIIKAVLFLLVVLALIFIPIIVYYVSLVQEREQIRKQVLALSTLISPEEEPTEENFLKEIVNKNFASSGKEYAVVIKNLKTDEEYRFNENKKFDSASLYKLWVMGVAFQKIKDGTIDEEQILSAKLEKLNNTLSTTSPTPTPEGLNNVPTPGEVKSISMTTKEAIEKMIIFSDNYAALLVASRAGTFSVTNFLKTYELNNSNFRSPPQTTANDIALYFEKLYKGEIVDKENSEKMIDILKRQAINDRIPKQLPEDVEVAHKTGELFGSKHDVGIVYAKKGDYIIVVMSDTKDPNKAVKKIANFSKEIYDYFEEY